ncbi:uncharacterized protein UTRI_04196 [Ustilago trichophora]|uniref:Uncharacterized protein n=1 Tax=Ustilago trichophora TaxID=86804 RepID=A0A5C3EPT6_9BASI|nr:uncharacterized protein UTRI_04196 [Ustilago trichophora]
MTLYVILLSCLLLVQATFALYSPVRSPVDEVLNHLEPLDDFIGYFDHHSPSRGGASSSNHYTFPDRLLEGSRFSPGPSHQWPDPQTHHWPNTHVQPSQYANPQHWQGTHSQEWSYPQSSFSHAPNNALPNQDHASFLTPQHAEYPSTLAGYPHNEASQPGLQNWNLHASQDTSLPERSAHVAQSHVDLHQGNELEAENPWDMYIRMLEGEHPSGASTASKSASDEAEEMSTSATPGFPERQQQHMSSDASSSIHFPMNQVESVDPVSVSGEPIRIIYQEDEGATKLIKSLKDTRVGGDKLRLGKPKRIPNPEVFLANSVRYFGTGRTAIKLMLGDRSFLLTFMDQIQTSFVGMQGRSVFVWELQRHGSGAFLVSRGMYPMRREIWSSISQSSSNPAYQIELKTGSNQLIFMAKPVDKTLLMRPTRKRLDANRPYNLYDPAASEDFWYSSVEYSPKQGLASPLLETLRKSVPEAKLGEEIHLNTPQDESVFAKALQAGLYRRANLMQIELDGKPYLITHHKLQFGIKALPASYVTIWRQGKEGDEHALVIVAIFPLAQHHFQQWKLAAQPAATRIFPQSRTH